MTACKLTPADTTPAPTATPLRNGEAGQSFGAALLLGALIFSFFPSWAISNESNLSFPPQQPDSTQSVTQHGPGTPLQSATPEQRKPLAETERIWLISLPLSVVFLSMLLSKSVPETTRELLQATLNPGMPKLLVSVVAATLLSSLLVYSYELARDITRDVNTPNDRTQRRRATEQPHQPEAAPRRPLE